MDERAMRRAIRIYLIADTGVVPPGDLPRAVDAALRGGVTIVQLRAKRLTTRDQLDLARTLAGACRARAVPFVVNDRVDIALASGADGVHVGHIGQEDMPPADARALVGNRAIVGVSVGSAREATAATSAGASYVSAGPMYLTRTKADAGAPVGPALIRAVRAATSLPVLAIGGIEPQHLRALVAAGADGVCVARGIISASDPESAARIYRQTMEEVAP